MTDLCTDEQFVIWWRSFTSGNYVYLDGELIDPYSVTFPDEQMAAFPGPSLSDILVFGPGDAIFADSATPIRDMIMMRDLHTAQRYAGWSDSELRKNWANFINWPAWSLFDPMHVATAFHAVTALMVIARMGEMAWEQVK